MATLKQKRAHCIYRAYIALARAESISLPSYTDAMMREDVESGKPRKAEVSYSYSEKFLELALRHRKATAETLFERGIAELPNEFVNKWICQVLRNSFGEQVVMDVSGFASGVFGYPSKYDFIVPNRDGKWITGYRLCQYSDLAKWGNNGGDV